MAHFYGRTYRYPTPEYGPQTIGVCEVLGSLWAVCWLRTTGSRCRVKTPHLPVLTNPEAVQLRLDEWAAKRGLEEVA